MNIRMTIPKKRLSSGIEACYLAYPRNQLRPPNGARDKRLPTSEARGTRQRRWWAVHSIAGLATHYEQKSGNVYRMAIFAPAGRSKAKNAEGSKAMI
jgi:hypothetical protein